MESTLPLSTRTRRILYTDYTASGRALDVVERYLLKDVLPLYANTHTVSSTTARQTTYFRSEARSIIKHYYNCGYNDALIFTGNGATGATAVFVDQLAKTNGFEQSGHFRKETRWGSIDPGVLIARKDLLTNGVPSTVGGGIVQYVSRKTHSYIDNHEDREEAGTPNIVGSIKAGLAYHVHCTLGVAAIAKLEETMTQKYDKFIFFARPTDFLHTLRKNGVSGNTLTGNASESAAVEEGISKKPRKKDLKSTIHGVMIPKSLRAAAGEAIREYSMINEGDRILVGLSGGKDSLSLLFILLMLQKVSPVKFRDIRVIRPLVHCREKAMRDMAVSNNLPLIADNCPACFAAPKERHRIKLLLSQQEHEFPSLFPTVLKAIKPLIAISETDQVRRRVHLSGNDIGDTGIRRLAPFLMHKQANHLVCLDLWNCNLGPSSGSVLGAAVASSRTLTDLKLGGNQLSDEGIIDLIAGLVTPQEGTRMGRTSVMNRRSSALGDFNRLTSFHENVCSYLPGASAARLANLSEDGEVNEFGRVDSALAGLAPPQTMRGCRLASLDISANLCGDASAAAIVTLIEATASPHNKTRSLNLRDNQYTLASCLAFINAAASVAHKVLNRSTSPHTRISPSLCKRADLRLVNISRNHLTQTDCDLLYVACRTQPIPSELESEAARGTSGLAFCSITFSPFDSDEQYTQYSYQPVNTLDALLTAVDRLDMAAAEEWRRDCGPDYASYRSPHGEKQTELVAMFGKHHSRGDPFFRHDSAAEYSPSDDERYSPMRQLEGNTFQSAALSKKQRQASAGRHTSSNPRSSPSGNSVFRDHVSLKELMKDAGRQHTTGTENNEGLLSRRSSTDSFRVHTFLDSEAGGTERVLFATDAGKHKKHDFMQGTAAQLQTPGSDLRAAGDSFECLAAAVREFDPKRYQKHDLDVEDLATNGDECPAPVDEPNPAYNAVRQAATGLERILHEGDGMTQANSESVPARDGSEAVDEMRYSSGRHPPPNSVAETNRAFSLSPGAASDLGKVPKRSPSPQNEASGTPRQLPPGLSQKARDAALLLGFCDSSMDARLGDRLDHSYPASAHREDLNRVVDQTAHEDDVPDDSDAPEILQMSELLSSYNNRSTPAMMASAPPPEHSEAQSFVSYANDDTYDGQQHERTAARAMEALADGVDILSVATPPPSVHRVPDGPGPEETADQEEGLPSSPANDHFEENDSGPPQEEDKQEHSIPDEGHRRLALNLTDKNQSDSPMDNDSTHAPVLTPHGVVHLQQDTARRAGAGAHSSPVTDILPAAEIIQVKSEEVNIDEGPVTPTPQAHTGDHNSPQSFSGERHNLRSRQSSSAGSPSSGPVPATFLVPPLDVTLDTLSQVNAAESCGERGDDSILHEAQMLDDADLSDRGGNSEHRSKHFGFETSEDSASGDEADGHVHRLLQRQASAFTALPSPADGHAVPTVLPDCTEDKPPQNVVVPTVEHTDFLQGRLFWGGEVPPDEQARIVADLIDKRNRQLDAAMLQESTAILKDQHIEQVKTDRSVIVSQCVLKPDGPARVKIVFEKKQFTVFKAKKRFRKSKLLHCVPALYTTTPESL
eukprot:gene20519-31596_t